MTNIEKIRSMDASELAEMLEDLLSPWCDPSDDDVAPETKQCKRWDCVGCAEKWLLTEVDDAGTE